MKNNSIVYENDNYLVQVAASEENVGGMAYQVVNKKTAVIEREDPVWPSAVQAAKYFDEEIKHVESSEATTEVVSKVFPISTH
jgi:hypothetical protein